MVCDYDEMSADSRASPGGENHEVRRSEAVEYVKGVDARDG